MSSENAKRSRWDELRAEASQLRERMPPSGRDFQVFEEVVVNCRPTRLLAEAMEISQTRICQIVERVWEWQERVLPRVDRDAPSEMLVKAAKYLAAERLNWLYGQTIKCFELSKGQQSKRKKTFLGEESVTTTTSQGDVRYLHTALKIIAAQAECGLPRGLTQATMALAEDDTQALLPATEAAAKAALELDGDLPGLRELVESPAAKPADVDTTHLDRECSENPAAEPVAAPAERIESAASACQPVRSKPLTRRQKQSRKAFFGPVQSPVKSGGDPPVTALRISPDVPGVKQLA
jgi:hypothetical protein